MNVCPSLKVVTMESLLLERGRLRNMRRTLVLTNGCFDLLHRGHVEYLWKSSRLGDVLAIAVNSDESVRKLKGASRPVNSAGDRAYVLAALEFVSWVFVFEGPTLSQEIEKLAPDVYTKGGDYSFETINVKEREALVKIHADIQFVPMLSGYSTTNTLQKSLGQSKND